MAANRDRLSLIEDISVIGGDLSPICARTLDRIIATIAARDGGRGLFALPVRSAARAPGAARDALASTRESVGRVSMRVNEGLVGLVIETGDPVVVEDAMSHPRYKYFPETGEERYHTFLGVPMQEGRQKPIGVLAVQTLRRRKFGTQRGAAAAHGGSPGRADPVALSTARDAGDQGEGTRRVSPPDDRGESPAQGLREGRRRDARRDPG